jgi:glycosyltransferase involved in cell wall biosynthesis/coenzyme F420-reducing hydrogenase beta subunit
MLVNVEDVGIRPQFDGVACSSCNACLTFCPGYTVNSGVSIDGGKASRLDCQFGPALEFWEGYASDATIRFRASSGGLLTALSLYCLEEEGMAFVLHTGMDEKQPWMNKTVQSRTRNELLSRAGSRYAPASPCDGLDEIEKSDQPCVFVGKPCDTAAVAQLRRQRPALDRSLGLVLTFFCAGTPSSLGTLDLLRSLSVAADEVHQIRYRGEGWPGSFKVCTASTEGSMSYETSWKQLTNYRPLRCKLCPDGLGYLGDISCGDAWHRYDSRTCDDGRSIAIVRTALGQRILRGAMAAGYVQLAPIESQEIRVAQPSLLDKRDELFGRLTALKLLRIPTPRFHGFSLLSNWIKLPLLQKARTIGGTLHRAISRGWWKPAKSRSARSRRKEIRRLRLKPNVVVHSTGGSRLRIAMLVYSFYESDTRVMQYAQALAQCGNEVDVICLRRPGQPVEQCLDGVNVHAIQTRPANERGKLSYAWRISRFLARSALFLARKCANRRYDLVHVHSVPDLLVFAALAPKMFGSKIILDIHDILPEFYASKFGIESGSLTFKALAAAERISIAFSDYVIIANEIWLQRLVSRSVAPGKCMAIRNYPDPEIFCPRETTRIDQDRQHFTIIYPGTLNHHQGLDIAIRAFARISVQMPGAEFCIYGQGPEKAMLARLIAQLGLTNRVHLYEFVPTKRIAPIMASSDLAVVPKRASSLFGDEAASTKVMEFMALGVPVIISRTKIDSYYFNESLVKFFESENDAALADAILELYRNPQLRKQLVHNGRNYVQQNNWNEKKQDYLALVDRLVSRVPLTATAVSEATKVGAVYR